MNSKEDVNMTKYAVVGDTVALALLLFDLRNLASSLWSSGSNSSFFSSVPLSLLHILTTFISYTPQKI